MNEQQLAAAKQALEALDIAQGLLAYAKSYLQPKMLAAYTALQSIIAQDALHKMAEESRTSGLRLDEWDKIGCVNHDCDKCKAVQEPVGTYGEIYESMQSLLRSGLQSDQQIHAAMKDKPLYTTPPAAQRQWVGLDFGARLDLISEAKGMGGRIVSDGQLIEMLIDCEAKLKEKNI